MSEEELRQHYEIITDCWKLMKKYHNPDDTDEYWEALIREGQKIYEKYKTEYAKREVLNVIEELDGKSRDNRGSI